MNKKILSSIWQALRQYFIFFLLMAFVISCSTMLFVSTMRDTMGITLTDKDVAIAAKLTFANVLFLASIITLIDGLRRKLTVERPVRRIIEAAEKITAGDFSARIEPLHFSDMNRFNDIIHHFNIMAQELSGTETLRTDFIANVSHELKTPLAVMQNYGAMLQQPGILEAQRMEYAKSITDACRRLASLITNILKLNKLENQQIFPIAEEYDLSEQLCESLLQFENTWEKKGIQVEADIAEDVRIRADAELLSLVWNNLLSNAFKFTPEGGEVSVSLQSNAEHAIVRVSDTGCGISPEVGEHIFEKFYQGDTSHASQGNGLGLALVKRVVDILHGEIAVESVLGQGSTFTVKIRRS